MGVEGRGYRGYDGPRRASDWVVGAEDGGEGGVDKALRRAGRGPQLEDAVRFIGVHEPLDEPVIAADLGSDLHR